MDNPLVRNIFHQYQHAENRLTHALVHALGSSQELLRSFIEFATGARPPAGAAMSLACQRQPGDRAEAAEEEASRLGVPDAWIYDEAKCWALALECKITAGLTPEQIAGHLATARRRDFSRIQVLVIDLGESRPAAIEQFSGAEVKWKSWPAVFKFFHLYRRIPLVAQFMDYMQVLEAELMGKISQPLTQFVGIPFGPSHPFNEAEAQVVLRGLLRDLRPRLAAVLPINLAAKSKPLTGSWDVIAYKADAPAMKFNQHPHLSVGIREEDTGIQFTLPNAALPEYWRRLRSASEDGLSPVLVQVTSRVRRRHVEGPAWEPQIILKLKQRHFYAMRRSVTDGEMYFDLENLADPSQVEGNIKRVPAWIDAINQILAAGSRSGANFELSVEARFPHLEKSISRKPEFVDQLVECALAFEPFRNLLLGEAVG